MTERLIIIGLINSTEYLRQVRSVWDIRYISGRSASMIAGWCVEYYDKYEEAPDRYIEDIYYDKKKSKEIPENLIEKIEHHLENLSGEYDEDFNVKYALDQTQKYFKERHLELHQDEVEKLQESGEGEAAQALAASYRGLTFELVDDLDLGKEEASLKLKNAFLTVSNPLIEYPGALGDVLNDQMIRGGFVALMAAEKRGKTWWLLDMAIRAALKRNKVAFFQAGDMTESQQLKRIGSYLTKYPTHEKYVGDIYIPEADCIMNQLDLCDKEERRCGFGVFIGGEYDESTIRDKVQRDDLIEAWKDWGDDYTPCTNCAEYKTHRLGTPWLRPKKINHVVTPEEAAKKLDAFFLNKNRHFRIKTYPNNTLYVRTIKAKLQQWEQTDGFIPAVIVIDYADLMVAEKTKEFRHAQNEIWKDLRALSQELDCLVLTATQADAKAYEKKTLTMSNYSEDKRKYAHVTAMFGLNQDKYGREKKIGIMRINELVIREGEFDTISTVSVLQSLTTGRPFLDSYI